MAVCIYCGERAGLLARSCKECRRLAETTQACAGQVGFSELLDRLEETGVHPEKIMRFLKADPDGLGSVRDRLTADMTNELLQIMGINERQTPDDVQRIRKITEKPPGSNQGNAD
ncbi:MAG: hypothetical protein OXN22_05590 [Deltaproteobacteria bacterium]|nr:hypothetical protein [Deltaproteobacteria bacterium]